jgi:thymidylate kinase
LIGDLIKARSKQLAWVADIRNRGIPFPTEFVADVILDELERDATYAVLDASISAGQALTLVKERRPINAATTFLLECPTDVRRTRYNERQRDTDRRESGDFFENREKLFDQHFASSLDVLRTHGAYHELDATQAVSVLTDEILQLLNSEDR